MTDVGFKVFRGAGGAAPKSTDFMALSQSRDVDGRARATLNALERVSVLRRPAAPTQAANASTRSTQPTANATQRPSAPPVRERTVRLIESFTGSFVR